MTQPEPSKRIRLSVDRVLDGAIELLDQSGLGEFTIRKLAVALNTKPMTIYHHVPNKDAILDGVTDRVFSEFELPPEGLSWKQAIRYRTVSARSVLGRHPWATPLLESRTTPGPHTLQHHDAVLGCFRGGGLSLALTAHAYALVDSYLHGFALQEANMPATGGEDMSDLAESIVQAFPEGLYPHLLELTAGHVLQPGYDFGDEFEFGLDLILDGIQDRADAEAHPPPTD